jgi:hypothetical protein
VGCHCRWQRARIALARDGNLMAGRPRSRRPQNRRPD